MTPGRRSRAASGHLAADVMGLILVVVVRGNRRPVQDRDGARPLLRVLGNEGTHFTGTRVNRENAQDALGLPEALLDYMYVFNEQFEALKKRRHSHTACGTPRQLSLRLQERAPNARLQPGTFGARSGTRRSSTASQIASSARHNLLTPLVGSVNKARPPGSSSALDMLSQHSGNNLTDANWHRITNKSPKPIEVNRLMLINKAIVSRKGLQHGSFAKRYSAILLRMTESPVPISKALSRYRWCDLVPLHPTINTRICRSALPIVAIRAQRIVPIAPTASWLRRPNSPQISTA